MSGGVGKWKVRKSRGAKKRDEPGRTSPCDESEIVCGGGERIGSHQVARGG